MPQLLALRDLYLGPNTQVNVYVAIKVFSDDNGVANRWWMGVWHRNVTLGSLAPAPVNNPIVELGQLPHNLNTGKGHVLVSAPRNEQFIIPTWLLYHPMQIPPPAIPQNLVLDVEQFRLTITLNPTNR